MVLRAQSTTKDYIKAEHKLHFFSKSFISQVIVPQVMFFEPIHIQRARNTGTCKRQGYLFNSSARTGTMCWPQPTQELSGEVLLKKKRKACEWTGRAEINKKEIPGSKSSMYGYILTYSRL